MASDIPVYGLDAELAAKRAAKYDPVMERQATEWIEAVTGQRLADPDNFHESLKDGRVLCALINKIEPGKISKINKNINKFLEACRDLGVKTADVFMTVDLYEAKNMGAVVQCIHALGGVVQKRRGYSLPVLGVRLADEHKVAHDPEKVLAARAAVPKLTKGAAEGANASGVSYGGRREIGGHDRGKERR